MDEKEKKLIQGRCLSVVCGIATTVDVLFYSAEHRNCVLNIMDLFIVWNREEASQIRRKFTVAKEEEVWLEAADE